MANEFKLVKSLGLDVMHDHRVSPPRPYVRASDLESLLEKGVRATKYQKRLSPMSHWNTDEVYGTATEDATHTGLLIGIEPIVRDTAESLLREFVDTYDGKIKTSVAQVIERAKRLLGEK